MLTFYFSNIDYAQRTGDSRFHCFPRVIAIGINNENPASFEKSAGYSLSQSLISFVGCNGINPTEVTLIFY